MQCPTCGFADAIPGPVQAQLQKAQALLQSTRARDRQLTGQQQRALTSSRSATVGYWLTTGLVSVPLIACGALGSVLALGGKNVSLTGALISIAPLSLFVLVAVLGQRSVKKRYAALRIACAAVPPVSPGQPAACHVCGGPLGAGSSAIARCGFCAADNVVAPDALEAAASARATLVAGVETTVRRQATLARTLTKQATLAIVASALGAPFFTLLLSFVVFMSLSYVEGPVDLSYRYGLVSTPSGKCIAHVYPHSTNKKWLLNFGEDPPEGMKRIEERDSVDDLPALTAGDFDGKRVKPSKDGNRPGGVIERVHGTMVGGNELVIAGKDHEPQGLCLDEP